MLLFGLFADGLNKSYLGKIFLFRRNYIPSSILPVFPACRRRRFSGGRRYGRGARRRSSFGFGV